MTSFLPSMFEHMAWADARVIQLLTSTPQGAQDSGVLRLLSHVLAAERVWLLRLRGEDAAHQPIWPEWTLEQARVVAEDNARAFLAMADATTEDDAARIVEYRNSQGVPFRNAAIDILLQVALHGSYHRGQIAAALRAANVAPINTDYITFVREQSAVPRA